MIFFAILKGYAYIPKIAVLLSFFGFILAKLLFINPFVEDFTAYNLWAAPLGLFRIMEYHESIGDDVTYLDFLDGDFVGDDAATPPVYRSWERHSYWKREIEKPECLKMIPRKYYRFGANDDTVRKTLSALEKPDKVYISTGMTYWYRSVLKMIDFVREIFGEVDIDIGGISAILMPEVFEGKGVFVNQGKAQIPESITGTGMRYINKLKFFPTNLIEGCPNRCPYCSSVIFNPKVSYKDIPTLAENLEKWHAETGHCDVAFYDDALMLKNGELLRDFLDRLPSNVYRFHTPNGLHLREINEDLCKYLEKYSFPQLRFGFETAFSRYEDKTSLNQLKSVVNLLKEHGFTSERIGVYLLCGLPGQTVEEVEKTIEIVAEIGARPYLNEYSPVPKTKLFEEHFKESKLDFKREPLYQNNSVSAWRSPVFTPVVVKKLKEQLYKIYSANM